MSKEVARREVAIIRPHLISRFAGKLGSTKWAGKHAPKRAVRRMLGWLRPIRCPKCKHYTKQMRATSPVGTAAQVRLCASCGTVFTRAESRRQLTRDRRTA